MPVTLVRTQREPTRFTRHPLPLESIMLNQIKDLPISKQVKLFLIIINDKNVSPASKALAQSKLNAIRAKGFLAG